ncbi:MAG: DNA-binding response regulator [Nitrospirae bacterium GWC2_46_6]|nr:MAG: DNA-binding response regulator [Nitrospirae bacterium GWC2_46_6]OGW21663.1 MAG: DNA-binding response regulator [Nitrospirae bacterium GWA2_46_11]OGW24363.1 MAG: DNA-binding response regulator [Nitrospirae bacterium GWB2_47_37]HAK88389.1 DNA-binding response regulator [Nitrospiraceae bacterium]HCL81126.1 DNA-binding response regulator [Nitrospiraceae bacterium]
MKKILVIDDEADIVELISYNLKKEGFAVDSSYNGEDALKKIKKNKYDLVILDLMLPGIQGLELCKMIRNAPNTSRLPIIMLTAKGEEFDKVLGLEMGADDYITKPFSTRELAARTKAILRRAEKAEPAVESAASGILKVRDMVIDKEKYTVTVDTRQIKLSATEFKLLLYLAERPNKIYNRDRLLDAVWGSDVYVEPRTVDVHIRRLRVKIEKDPNNPKYIKTMRGIGYLIES